MLLLYTLTHLRRRLGILSAGDFEDSLEHLDVDAALVGGGHLAGGGRGSGGGWTEPDAGGILHTGHTEPEVEEDS